MSVLLNPYLFGVAGEQLFTRVAETLFSDFNDFSGGTLAKLFDGTTNQAITGGTTLPYKASASFGYFGVTFGSARAISRVIVYGPNDSGFFYSANPATTIDLYGKAGSAPASSTDGTLLGSVSFTDTANESGGRSITSSDTTTTFDHCWVRISSGTTNSVCAAELTIYYI